MNIGDLVKYAEGMPQNNIPGKWGFGLVIGFVESGMPNHYPWILVYWGAWNHTSQGPVSYFEVIK